MNLNSCLLTTFLICALINIWMFIRRTQPSPTLKLQLLLRLFFETCRTVISSLFTSYKKQYFALRFEISLICCPGCASLIISFNEHTQSEAGCRPTVQLCSLVQIDKQQNIFFLDEPACLFIIEAQCWVWHRLIHAHICWICSAKWKRILQ